MTLHTLPHSQVFNKINRFLKPVLNIFILRKLKMREVNIKNRTGIFHQIYKFSGDANSCGSRIHQIKSWYYLGPFQISKVDFFAKILSSYKPLTFL